MTALWTSQLGQAKPKVTNRRHPFCTVIGVSENHRFLGPKSQKNHTVFVIFSTFKINIIVHLCAVIGKIFCELTSHIRSTVAQWTLGYRNISPPLHPKKQQHTRQIQYHNFSLLYQKKRRYQAPHQSSQTLQTRTLNQILSRKTVNRRVSMIQINLNRMRMSSANQNRKQRRQS